MSSFVDNEKLSESKQQQTQPQPFQDIRRRQQPEGANEALEQLIRTDYDYADREEAGRPLSEQLQSRESPQTTAPRQAANSNNIVQPEPVTSGGQQVPASDVKRQGGVARATPLCCEQDTKPTSNVRAQFTCPKELCLAAENALPSPVDVLPPLPPGLSSSTGPHLPHISSEPTFGVQLRRNQEEQEQQNSTKANGDKIAPAPSTSHILKSGTVSASGSPNMVRKSSDGAGMLPRRVSFPKSDNELVTGYLEPANPWMHSTVKNVAEIAEEYMASCRRHKTTPLRCVLDQLKTVDLTQQWRQPLLSLKCIHLEPSDCEALEEVWKRLQYKSIDLSDCKLNEMAATALFDMIEYYEATNELDISSNAQGMTHRGWVSCTSMISRSRELHVLAAEGNPIDRMSADNLGKSLISSNLHTLKLERCNLKGAPLSDLCFKLRANRVLKELWIAYNELESSDAETVAEMLKVNHYLELIDISNNNIGDEGLHYIVMSLILQSKELERRTTFQRTAAIDDDETMSPFETSAPVDLSDGKECDRSEVGWSVSDPCPVSTTCEESKVEIREVKCKKPLTTIDEKQKGVNGSATQSRATAAAAGEPAPRPATSSKPPLISTVGTTIEEIDPDEDTDDTIRLGTTKNSAAGGQSMLDKLLSMNSESSSEDGVSNLSTDTLAACCSEDVSLISDDIFDVAATATTTITIASANVKLAALEDSVEDTVTVSAASNPTIMSVGSRSPYQNSSLAESAAVVATAIGSVATLTDAGNSVTPDSPFNDPVAVIAGQSPHPASVVNANVSANNNNNNNVDNNNVNAAPAAVSSSVFEAHLPAEVLPTSGIFELKAEESNCSQGVAVGDSGQSRHVSNHAGALPHHVASKALDVNKNSKMAEDFDDTHSTDSAFESASEGDISRNLPEEFTRLSASLESTRLDDIAKEYSIETATIASESNECLIAAAAQFTPSSTPTPQKTPFTQLAAPISERERILPDVSLSASLSSMAEAQAPAGFEAQFADKMPKVTIAQDSIAQKYKDYSVVSTNPSQTPPPPSTSPGGASAGLRRTDSSCAFLTQSSRNRSQSTDSLCSDNSLDGSIGSGDLHFSSSVQLNEKITKNDTLSRQQRQQESAADGSTRTPGGLKALALWNNKLSKKAGLYISELLAETTSVELLNIGKNSLSNDFVVSIKDSLTKNTTLTTLGLQSAQLSAEGIETLTSIMTFGGNSTLQRIDIRGNRVEVESLTKIAEVLKSNTTITQIDIDDEPKRLSVGSEAHLEYARVLENVRSMCARNEKAQAQAQQERASAHPLGKRRGGYYLGSRKISLTCHSRPIIDTTTSVVVTCNAPSNNSKLEVKRKAGTRLRSPVPSPTTISPSSSPNRASRFQVFPVTEVSPLSSSGVPKSMGGLAGTKARSSSSVFIEAASPHGGNVDSAYPSLAPTSLPTSCSLPSMATISSSTQSIKRLSMSPRSRFLVNKIYEDPSVPLSNRTVPPITPPIYPPPTPMSKSAKETMLTFPPEAAPPLRAFMHSRSPIMPPTIVTPPTNTPSPSPSSPSPLSAMQQQDSTSTSACAAPVPSAKEHLPPTHVEQSTNNKLNNDTVSLNQGKPDFVAGAAGSRSDKSVPLQLSSSTQSTLTTLSTSSSPLSSSSSSSSSSSASTQSTSSPSSTASSSSSSSTSPASNIDSSDSSSPSSASPLVQLTPEGLADSQELTVSGKCPIAVFGDNDITLTKNSVNDALVSAVAVAVSRGSAGSVASDDSGVPTTTSQNQRVRKLSWMANPTSVDKLRTLFHNPFQRSSSPEAKVALVPSTVAGPTTIPVGQDSSDQSLEPQQQMAAAHNRGLLPLRKQSPPSWTKLGTDILSAAGGNNADLAGAVATTAAAVVTEQSRSFLDAASRLRDFMTSKQVFRQSLPFGNEALTTGSTTTITSSTVHHPRDGVGPRSEYGQPDPSAGGGGYAIAGSSMECSAISLPTDERMEIKENISPIHKEKGRSNTDSTAADLQSEGGDLRVACARASESQKVGDRE